jgi:hypothetical protein
MCCCELGKPEGLSNSCDIGGKPHFSGPVKYPLPVSGIPKTTAMIQSCQSDISPSVRLSPATDSLRLPRERGATRTIYAIQAWPNIFHSEKDRN